MYISWYNVYIYIQSTYSKCWLKRIRWQKGNHLMKWLFLREIMLRSSLTCLFESWVLSIHSFWIYSRMPQKSPAGKSRVWYHEQRVMSIATGDISSAEHEQSLWWCTHINIYFFSFVFHIWHRCPTKCGAACSTTLWKFCLKLISSCFRFRESWWTFMKLLEFTQTDAMWKATIQHNWAMKKDLRGYRGSYYLGIIMQ